MKTIGIGLAGFGTVGSGVWEILKKNKELIEKRTQHSFQLSIEKIAIRNKEKAVQAGAPEALLTTDLEALVHAPEVEIIVELIGGTDAAFDLVASALRAGKPVITGNKALLAERGAELFPLAEQHGVPLHFEAAVAGAIPVIEGVKTSLIGNEIESIVGIINGTSNYILERMTKAGLTYQEALKEAKELGYAEADETLDVNGWDAAHKAILLTSLAHGFLIDASKVYVRGIERVRSIDIKFAKNLGYQVKQLCVVRKQENGQIELRTQPSFIPQSHILSSVHGVFNAISIVGDACGESLFYGRGAGQLPTGSSVVGDIIEVARGMVSGHYRGFLPYSAAQDILVDINETETPYYVRFDVNDELGVIAKIANILAEHEIGISGTHSPVNPDNPDQDFVEMVFLLHTCTFSKLKKALKQVELLECVTERPTVFRIESFN